MNLKRKIVALAGAAVLTASLNAAALAQTSDNVTVTLGGGVISFSIDVTDNLDPLAYDHQNGYSDAAGGEFTVVVMDDRNTNTGYVINLAASDFTRSGGGVIDLGVGEAVLSVPTAGTVTRINGDATNLPSANTVANLAHTPVAIVTAAAGFGNGHYSVDGYGLALANVSAIVPGGTYTSTLTVTSPSAPTQ